MMITQSISRSGLYYNKFAYKFTIYTRGARAIKNHKNLVQTQYLKKKHLYFDDVYDNDFYFLCIFSDIVKTAESENKQVVSHFAIHFYTNNKQDIDKISSELKRNQISCAYYLTYLDKVYKKDTVNLQKPLFQNRSFLNNFTLTESQLKALEQFFTDNSAVCKPSKTVSKICRGQHRWIKNHFRTTDFVDHDFSSQEIMFLNIIAPGLFRSTKKIYAK